MLVSVGQYFVRPLTAEYLKNCTKISAFTDVHVEVLAFTHRAIMLVSRRYWVMESKSLHQPYPPPLPFLFAKEHT
jgi:hypothetical protein